MTRAFYVQGGPSACHSPSVTQTACYPEIDLQHRLAQITSRGGQRCAVLVSRKLSLFEQTNRFQTPARVCSPEGGQRGEQSLCHTIWVSGKFDAKKRFAFVCLGETQQCTQGPSVTQTWFFTNTIAKTDWRLLPPAQRGRRPTQSHKFGLIFCSETNDPNIDPRFSNAGGGNCAQPLCRTDWVFLKQRSSSEIRKFYVQGGPSGAAPLCQRTCVLLKNDPKSRFAAFIYRRRAQRCTAPPSHKRCFPKSTTQQTHSQFSSTGGKAQQCTVTAAKQIDCPKTAISTTDSVFLLTGGHSDARPLCHTTRAFRPTKNDSPNPFAYFNVGGEGTALHRPYATHFLC